MFDDGSDELIGGAWPFLKRALIVFLPLWVYLIFWTATHQIFVSAIAAGFSVPLIQLFEKLKLKRKMESEGR